ncbi:35004_t:CDS:2, partial [Gigaspora margarita]
MDEWAEITKENQLEDFKSYLKEGEVYDPSLHYDKEWVHGSIRTIVNLARIQYENWYFGNILGQCLDYCFRDSILGTDIK